MMLDPTYGTRLKEELTVVCKANKIPVWMSYPNDNKINFKFTPHHGAKIPPFILSWDDKKLTVTSAVTAQELVFDANINKEELITSLLPFAYMAHSKHKRSPIFKDNQTRLRTEDGKDILITAKLVRGNFELKFTIDDKTELITTGSDWPSSGSLETYIQKAVLEPLTSRYQKVCKTYHELVNHLNGMGLEAWEPDTAVGSGTPELLRTPIGTFTLAEIVDGTPNKSQFSSYEERVEVTIEQIQKYVKAIQEFTPGKKVALESVIDSTSLESEVELS